MAVGFDMNKLLNDPNLVAALCGIAAFAVVVLIWVALVERDPLSGRLRNVARHREVFQAERKARPSRRAALKRSGFAKRVADMLLSSDGEAMADMRLKLKRAGYHSREAVFTYVLARLGAMIGFFAMALFFIFVARVGDMKPAAGFGVAFGVSILGWLLPVVLLKNQTQKREDELRKGMPDALDLMVICAEAGLGMDASFDRVGREIGPTCPELAEEMGMTGVELNFLPDRHKALQGLAERVPLPGVLALVNTLIQTEKYGTPLAQALRVLSAEMRDERMMRAEEKAARLPAILTVPMIVFILPPLFVVLIGPAVIKVMSAMGGK